MGIAQLLRIPPWDLERLTVQQLLDAVKLVDDTNAEAQKHT